MFLTLKKNTPSTQNYRHQKDLNKSIEANADDNGGIVPVLQMSTEFKICLQNARLFNNLSQSDLANKLNVQSNLYQRWESGKENPPPNIVAKLNNILKVKLPKISKNINKL